ncbi:IS3 family transposase [Terasakiella pusilla]|uniref:IS3 family transposase n=1 Tax=Terasakiella pusilla TaxID=64973 RepID=UPI003AA7F73D
MINYFYQLERNCPYQSYGRGRMTDEVQEEGICVGEHRVARIMKQNNLRIV